MLFTKKHDEKLKTPEQIDKCISAEIPEEGLLKGKVIRHMLHGPHTESFPCLNENSECSKKVPKRFIEQTEMNEKGYPHYKHRDNRAAGNTLRKSVDS